MPQKKNTGLKKTIGFLTFSSQAASYTPSFFSDNIFLLFKKKACLCCRILREASDISIIVVLLVFVMGQLFFLFFFSKAV